MNCFSSTHRFLKMFVCVFSVFVATNAFCKASDVASDAVITGKVKSKIALDSSVSVFDVKVVTQNGVVSLSGLVDTNDQAGALVEIAQSIQGVHDVNTAHLKVKDSQHPFNDAAITAKVKGVFVREQLFGQKEVSAWNLRVQTVNGVVHLSGKACNQEEISNAMALAKSIKGAKEVKSDVEVDEAVC